MNRRVRVLLLVFLSGCGGTGSSAATASPTVCVGIWRRRSGDGQAAASGATLSQPLRVIVTQAGAPLAGQLVIWQTATGSLPLNQTTTGSDGIAASNWTLGNTCGFQTATAFLGNLGGASATFTGLAATTVAGPHVKVDMYSAGSAGFQPAAIIIAPGTTVTWGWIDGTHNILSNGSPSFADAPTSTGPPRSYRFTFNTPGTYHYYCTTVASMEQPRPECTAS